MRINSISAVRSNQIQNNSSTNNISSSVMSIPRDSFSQTFKGKCWLEKKGKFFSPESIDRMSSEQILLMAKSLYYHHFGGLSHNEIRSACGFERSFWEKISSKPFTPIQYQAALRANRLTNAYDQVKAIINDLLERRYKAGEETELGKKLHEEYKAYMPEHKIEKLDLKLRKTDEGDGSVSDALFKQL